MTKNIRESELALKTWTPLPPTLDTDVVSDPDIVGNLQQVSQLSSATSSGSSGMHTPQSVGCAGEYATFTNGTLGTGLRYLVWKVVQGYAECTRILETPTTRPVQRIPVVIKVNSLTGSNSEWPTACAQT